MAEPSEGLVKDIKDGTPGLFVAVIVATENGPQLRMMFLPKGEKNCNQKRTARWEGSSAPAKEFARELHFEFDDIKDKVIFTEEWKAKNQKLWGLVKGIVAWKVVLKSTTRSASSAEPQPQPQPPAPQPPAPQPPAPAPQPPAPQPPAPAPQPPAPQPSASEPSAPEPSAPEQPAREPPAPVAEAVSRTSSSSSSCTTGAFSTMPSTFSAALVSPVPASAPATAILSVPAIPMLAPDLDERIESPPPMPQLPSFMRADIVEESSSQACVETGQPQVAVPMEGVVQPAVVEALKHIGMVAENKSLHVEEDKSEECDPDAVSKFCISLKPKGLIMQANNRSIMMPKPSAERKEGASTLAQQPRAPFATPTSANQRSGGSTSKRTRSESQDAQLQALTLQSQNLALPHSTSQDAQSQEKKKKAKKTPSRRKSSEAMNDGGASHFFVRNDEQLESFTPGDHLEHGQLVSQTDDSDASVGDPQGNIITLYEEPYMPCLHRPLPNFPPVEAFSEVVDPSTEVTMSAGFGQGLLDNAMMEQFPPQQPQAMFSGHGTAFQQMFAQQEQQLLGLMSVIHAPPPQPQQHLLQPQQPHLQPQQAFLQLQESLHSTTTSTTTSSFSSNEVQELLVLATAFPNNTVHEASSSISSSADLFESQLEMEECKEETMRLVQQKCSGERVPCCLNPRELCLNNSGGRCPDERLVRLCTNDHYACVGCLLDIFGVWHAKALNGSNFKALMVCPAKHCNCMLNRASIEAQECIKPNHCTDVFVRIDEVLATRTEPMTLEDFKAVARDVVFAEIDKIILEKIAGKTDELEGNVVKHPRSSFKRVFSSLFKAVEYAHAIRVLWYLQAFEAVLQVWRERASNVFPPLEMDEPTNPGDELGGHGDGGGSV